MKAMTKLKLAVAIILLAAFAVVVLQNATVTEVKFFAWQFKMSLIVLLIAPVVLGFVLGYLIAKLTGGGPGKA